jgi:hypothetical protein
VNARSGTFTLLIDTAITAGEQILNVPGVNLTVIGISAERKISPASSGGRLFTLRNRKKKKIRLTIGKNITLAGHENSTDTIVSVEGAEFIMLDGSKITGFSGIAYVVDVLRPGVFIMKGGVITGNTSTDPAYLSAAVHVMDKFIMEGGSISGNNATSDVFLGNNNPVSIAGSAEIGVLSLNVYRGDYFYRGGYSPAVIGPGWTGSVNSLNLYGGTDDMAELTAWSEGKPFLQAAPGHTLTAADVAKFPLGHFLCKTLTRPIAGGGMINYRIADSGEKIGTLVKAG